MHMQATPALQTQMGGGSIIEDDDQKAFAFDKQDDMKELLSDFDLSG